MTFDFLANPCRDLSFQPEPLPAEPWDFHRRLPNYEPTRLARLDDLAAEVGVRRVRIKDESARLGLPAFKILGVSWALYRALSERLGAEPQGWTTLEDLRAAFAPAMPITVTAATDGNHGRALARVARWYGAEAKIFVSDHVPPARAAAIVAEGAELVTIEGTYDDAVATAKAESAEHSMLLISDAAVGPEEVIPSWIAAGYATMTREIDAQLEALGEPDPDVILVQMGVGGMAGAFAYHYRRRGRINQPRLIGVEPTSAACVMESARAGELKQVPGPHTSRMDCLAAGLPSVTTFAAVAAAFDGFVSAGDELVAKSVQDLALAGVVAGPTGVAGVVGLRAAKDTLRLDPDDSVLLVNSEGAADFDGYVRALSER